MQKVTIEMMSCQENKTVVEHSLRMDHNFYVLACLLHDRKGRVVFSYVLWVVIVQQSFVGVIRWFSYFVMDRFESWNHSVIDTILCSSPFFLALLF